MIKRGSIAVDVDDVIALHADAFVEFSNQNYGTNLSVEDYQEHWADIWQVDHEEVERRAREFQSHDGLMGFKVVTEADTVLKRLIKRFDLYVVTARPGHLMAPTIQWLDKFYRGIFKDVHFVPYWEPDSGRQVTKADICHQIGASYLIDDLPMHCNIAAQAGITALLFGDYAWARGEKLELGVVEVKDWAEIGKYFDEQGR